MRAARRANIAAWLAGLALIGTYAATCGFKPKRPAPPAEHPSAKLRGWPFWKHVLYRTYEQLNEDRLLALAAGVVFYGLLALFPAITALVSSYALFATPTTIVGHLAALASIMPGSAYKLVAEQVARIAASTPGKLSVAFVFGLAFALWSANAGVKAIIDALNIVYGVKERRGIIHLNLLSLTFTVGIIAGLLLTIAAIVALPIVFSYLPIDAYADPLITLLRWPALFVLLLFGLAVLYRFGPDLNQPRWHWISAGNIFAALAWLPGSLLLSWYLSNFANYDVTYGSLGAGIGLMVWLWFTAIVVLVGAELNSEIEAARMPVIKAPEVGDCRGSRPC